MDDETQYYKDDFTYNNKRDVSGIFKTIKTQYKQLKLRTYEIFFDKTEYDIYVDQSWWKISICDDDNNIFAFNWIWCY